MLCLGHARGTDLPNQHNMESANHARAWVRDVRWGRCGVDDALVGLLLRLLSTVVDPCDIPDFFPSQNMVRFPTSSFTCRTEKLLKTFPPVFTVSSPALYPATYRFCSHQCVAIATRRFGKRDGGLLATRARHSFST